MSQRLVAEIPCAKLQFVAHGAHRPAHVSLSCLSGLHVGVHAAVSPSVLLFSRPCSAGRRRACPSAADVQHEMPLVVHEGEHPVQV